VHVLHRGTDRDAAVLVRGIIGAGDDRARTAHDVAADTDRDQLPDRVASLLDRRTRAVAARRITYRHWHQQVHDVAAERQQTIAQHLTRSHDLDSGIEL
jgi:hypothetical protein